MGKMGKKKKRINLFDKNLDEIRHAYDTFTKRDFKYEVDHRQDQDFKSETEKMDATPLLHLDGDHPKPVTRRDFISQGFIAGSLSIGVPASLSMLAPWAAKAQDCATAGGGGGGGGGIFPVFIIDGSGGACYAGNNVPLDAGGAPLADQTNFGVNPAGVEIEMFRLLWNTPL